MRHGGCRQVRASDPDALVPRQLNERRRDARVLKRRRLGERGQRHEHVQVRVQAVRGRGALHPAEELPQRRQRVVQLLPQRDDGGRLGRGGATGQHHLQAAQQLEGAAVQRPRLDHQGRQRGHDDGHLVSAGAKQDLRGAAHLHNSTAAGRRGRTRVSRTAAWPCGCPRLGSARSRGGRTTTRKR